MSEVPHRDPAETASHDANGAVKMHTDANDHLDRLFAADKAEIPWFVSLYQNILDIIRPEKLPPLVITSKPVAVGTMASSNPSPDAGRPHALRPQLGSWASTRSPPARPRPPSVTYGPVKALPTP